jgi:putative FmdB family regulatory protein
LRAIVSLPRNPLNWDKVQIMPLYEYECTACHQHTEKIQKFSDPEITTCPHCGGALKRVISAPAFSLKGGGWYADGYGSAKPAAASSEGAAAPASSEAGSTTATPASAPAAPASAPAAAAADKK